MRKINKIIIHCTATPEGRDVSIDEVRRWHFLVRLDGTVEEGRPIEMTGAHTRSHNWDSIGIAYSGGTGKNGEWLDTRTDAQKDALVDLICQLHDCYGGTVYGHRDFSEKACPSFDAKTEYENISNRF